MRERSAAVLGIVWLCAVLAYASLLRAAPAAPNHVQASFVAADDAVRPGKTITIALRFVHDPHWHTYWLNPGTGLPTTIRCASVSVTATSSTRGPLPG